MDPSIDTVCPRFADAGLTLAPMSQHATETSKLPVATLPAPSVAMQLTVVVPMGNVLPVVSVQTGMTVPLTRSIAETPKVTAAPAPDCAIWIGTLGTVNSGGVVSACTVT